MPVFSIIMAVYNNERYFPKAVQSILSQNYADFELIIIDDGSTDRTAQIADLIAKGDRRVRIVHQKNQWIFASLNNGIQMATGDYIYFVNSDDRLRPGSLKKLADIVKCFCPDVIWTKVLTHKCDDNQKIIEYDCHGFDKRIDYNIFLKNAHEFRANWIFLNKACLATNQINLYKSNLIKKHRFRNDIYGADRLFNINLASEINTSYILKEAVYDHFNYMSEEMNASIGKYYGYEHEMFNLFYKENKRLLYEWGHLNKEALDYLASVRLREISIQLRSFNSKCCGLNLEEKLKIIFELFLDIYIYNLADKSGKIEELEARILFGLRELFLREEIDSKSHFYFSYELTYLLLLYEKDEGDYNRLRNAINHPLNKYNIGQCFYKKLIGDNIDV
ncbi:hypothetical protein LXJ15735_03720 [Lacrimispora xylanolytica]